MFFIFLDQLSNTMHPRLYQSIHQWCQAHDWTDLFFEQAQFWAFPPGSVMPMPIPARALEGFAANHEMPLKTRLLNGTCLGTALGASILTVLTLSPLPLLLAFGCCTVTVALLDE
jgi:hypothetical protein